MSLVTVSYNGNVIHTADGGENFTLDTQGKYLEGDVEVVVAESQIEELPEAYGESF